MKWVRENGVITEFAVDDERVTKNDIERLTAFPKLHTVRLELCRLEDGVPEALAALDIGMLDLEQAKLPDGDLRFLLKMPKLRALTLSWMTINDASFEAILKCSQLKALDISFTNLSTEQGARLEKELANTRVFSTGLKH